MEEEMEFIFEETKEGMDNSITHLHKELSQLRTGKASPATLNGIMVSYYGSKTPLKQVANVSTADSRTLTIQPWEKSMLAPIEKAIFEANLGYTPQNDGQIIRINIPPLTEERRRGLVKRAKSLGEDAKVSIRNARQTAMKDIKGLVKDGYPEDHGKRKEDEIDKETKKYSDKVDKLVDVKEKDIMTV